jgi:hypothetical protein
MSGKSNNPSRRRPQRQLGRRSRWELWHAKLVTAPKKITRTLGSQPPYGSGCGRTWLLGEIAP